VEPTALSPFAAWESFYVIVGSSAAALTGLQFVVIALSAESRAGGTAEVGAFGTPTVVHFCAVLLVAAVFSAPWSAVASAATLLGGLGLAGIVYVLIVTRRARRQTKYTPVLEDWLWHTVFPFGAYAAVLVGAIVLRRNALTAGFVIAAAAMVLLFIGIHNAWDAVTYIATVAVHRHKDQ
jgi:hypothetical protein